MIMTIEVNISLSLYIYIYIYTHIHIHIEPLELGGEPDAALRGRQQAVQREAVAGGLRGRRLRSPKTLRPLNLEALRP